MLLLVEISAELLPYLFSEKVLLNPFYFPSVSMLIVGGCFYSKLSSESLGLVRPLMVVFLLGELLGDLWDFLREAARDGVGTSSENLRSMRLINADSCSNSSLSLAFTYTQTKE